MLQEQIRDNIANATVTLPKLKGQGVLVDNGIIITAAHCIDYSCEGEMALGEYFIETIKTANSEFRLSVLAVEPVADIAALSLHDDQPFSTDESFLDYCRNTKPVPISQTNEANDFRVHIYTHHSTWVTGVAKSNYNDGKTLGIIADEPIRGGTSGGPVVNEKGELVGLASSFSLTTESHRECTGEASRPHLALPLWIINRIFADRDPYYYD